MHLLDALAHCDVIERVAALSHVIRGQRSWQFAMLRCGGITGIQAERLVKMYGIPVWDRDFSEDFLFYRVPLQQANWAEYILLCGGVPLVGRVFNPKNQVYAIRRQGRMPVPWGKR